VPKANALNFATRAKGYKPFSLGLQKILMSSKAKSEYIELSRFGLINCAPDSSAEGGCV